MSHMRPDIRYASAYNDAYQAISNIRHYRDSIYFCVKIHNPIFGHVKKIGALT